MQLPPGQSEGPAPSGWGRRIAGATRELVVTIVPAVLIALFVNAFLAQSTVVYGQSMEPNLHTDERLMVEKVSYRLRGPERGDIVVVADPTGGPIPLIKRVLGLSGETVSISGGRVYIDGRPLDEPYIGQITQGEGRSWRIPPLHVFVMGDNRGNSKDSRYFGPLAIDSIVGHAVFRFWPLNKFGLVR